MTTGTLIRRSLRYHWRAHLGVVLGAAIGSAALIGALIVGDSVRESLRERALERLGWVHAAMEAPDRTFTWMLEGQLRGNFSKTLEATNRTPLTSNQLFSLQHETVALLRLPGIASRPDGTARANAANILGIPTRLFLNERNSPYEDIPSGQVALNEALAAQLHARPGDELILRVPKPGGLSREATLSPQGEATVVLRARVHSIIPADKLGNFSLTPSQVPPLNVFIGRGDLAKALGEEFPANILLAGEARQGSLPPAASGFASWCRAHGAFGDFLLRTSRPFGFGKVHRERYGSVITAQHFNDILPRALHAADLSLKLKSPASNVLDVTSTRVFLDEPVARALLASDTPFTEIILTNGRVLPRPVAFNAATNRTLILTYLVNLLRADTNTTPYSMVTAAGPPFTPPDLRDDEIIINEWLAEDLQARPGSEIELTYFLADSGAQLVERTNRFRVRAIVPLSGQYADRSLMPDFPGIAKAESTQDWDAGFPLTHKIRPKDDAYWKQHRGTPKAFVTLAAGQGLWANRFGKLTTIRFRAPYRIQFSYESLLRDTMQNLDPSEIGLHFEPVREQAERAAAQSQDFGGLFIGFSFFLIGAALILMALLFQFGIEQRAAEIGTLLALGFPARRVRKLFLLEGAALAFLGSVLGVAGGIFYARAMLHGLTTVWRSATNTSVLTFHASPVTLITGLISGTVVAVITIWFVLRKQARQPARALLAGDLECGDLSPPSRSATCRRTDSATSRGMKRLREVAALQKLFTAPVIAWASLALAIIIIAWAFISGETSNAGFFFGAGSLALIAGLAFTFAWLGSSRDHETPSSPSSVRVSLSRLLRSAAARRKSRSVATVALLACGVFLIVSIGAFRLDAEADAWKRSSGTGGFALMGESTLPIVKDLNTKEGRAALGLDEKILQDVKFVPFRVRDGDDASCLNLNRAQQPRLLGVKSEPLRERFTFATKPNLAATGVTNKGDYWASLRWNGFAVNGSIVSPSFIDPTVHAIGDAASIQWALHKKIGDTLAYRDERGNDFSVRLVGGLANSILQGSLIIDEAEFTRRFPGVSGYRMFLIDCPSNALPQVSAELSRALQDYGFEVTPTAQRLAVFNAVQNTYLNTFQMLGGLGLLLGSAGLGIVVLRNVLERRGELALLIAVGFRRRRVQALVLAEHAALLGLGLMIGVASALVAILPSLLSPRGELPVISLALTLGGVLLFGLVSTWLATRVAVRGNLLEGLRNE